MVNLPNHFLEHQHRRFFRALKDRVRYESEILKSARGRVSKRLQDLARSACVNGIGIRIIGRRGIRYTSDVVEKLEMGRLESLEFCSTASGFKILGLTKQDPCAGNVDIFKPTAVKRDMTGIASVDLVERISQGTYIVEHPIFLQANRHFSGA